MNILFLDNIGEDMFSLHKEHSPSYMNLKYIDDKNKTDDYLKDAEILVTKKTIINQDLLKKVPNLKFVQLLSNRSDKIDPNIIENKSFKIALLPQVGCIAVSELAMTLMLSLSKKITVGHELTMSSAYLKLNIEPFKTEERKHNFQWMKINNIFEIYGKSLGIIGFGEIGTELSRRAKSFGMKVNYYSRNKLPTHIENFEGVKYQDLETLLSSNDFISLHLPHTSESNKMINKNTLSLIKKNSFIINTSRGGLIDEDDLYYYLKNNKIAGAGLDVFLYEPLPSNHPFMSLANVILCHHIGGGSGGARIKHVKNLIDNLSMFIKSGKTNYEIFN